MKILSKSLFAASGTRSSSQRETDVLKADPIISKEFLEFGKDYFDGGPESAGYQLYSYDGRYKVATEMIIKKFKLTSQSKILEFGCAKAFILYEFYKNGIKNIKGFDISSYAISNAPEPIREFLVCQDFKLDKSSDDSAYDFVFSKEVLPHLNTDELRTTLPLLAKKLTPTGTLYLEVQVAQNEMAYNKIMSFDPTHKTLKDSIWWQKFILENMPDNVNIECYFKELF